MVKQGNVKRPVVSLLSPEFIERTIEDVVLQSFSDKSTMPKC